MRVSFPIVFVHRINRPEDLLRPIQEINDWISGPKAIEGRQNMQGRGAEHFKRPRCLLGRKWIRGPTNKEGQCLCRTDQRPLASTEELKEQTPA